MSVLWSVLAIIGTVLLFLLKGVGILLLVVLVLGLLLMFCPFCADVQWAEGIFQVKAGALGITFPVFRYPAPEKPEKKKKAMEHFHRFTGASCLTRTGDTLINSQVL